MVKYWVPGFKGLYYITSDGEIYNYKRNRKLTIRKKRNGYTVTLYKDKKYKEISISQIIRQCVFNGKEGKLMHLNKDGSDFRFSNLKLTNQSEISSRNRGSNQKTVIYRSPDGEETAYASTVEAGKALNVSRSTVSYCCRNKRMLPCINGEVFYE